MGAEYRVRIALSAQDGAIDSILELRGWRKILLRGHLTHPQK
jgi:hypothetical protein